MALYRATANGQVELTPEEEAELRELWARNDARVNVPQVVTMRQARLALSNAGLLSSVNVAVSTLSEQIQITWEYSQEVKRDNPYIIEIANQLGLTSEQVDNLFIQAAQL